MNKISFTLNKDYKSFEKQFTYQFEGDLILISGINGAGKSQIINILLGREGKQNRKIESTVKINGIQLQSKEIEYRSFRENVSIQNIVSSNSQVFLESANQAWSQYSGNRLQENSNPQYIDSCIEAKRILFKKFSTVDFSRNSIKHDDFKQTLIQSGFIWKAGDIFTNIISEAFFAHALKISEKMKEVGRPNFKSSMIPETAPWQELNSLFKQLNFNYRFKDNYEIVGVEINEQPKLFPVNNEEEPDFDSPRQLSDLSDGEKAIISLSFVSLRDRTVSNKKLMLLDEIDAVLNPSLIETLFVVLKRYFLDKGVSVIMTTHSPATISLSPLHTRYYEVFRKNQLKQRILEVDRDEYTELHIANKRFYEKISNQEDRIRSLEGRIDIDEPILILTEGKTDWKYILRALRFFHERNEFTQIMESYFYKYGSEAEVSQCICGTEMVNELSETQLNNYLLSLVVSRQVDNSQVDRLRIGIFDSDTSKSIVSNESLGVFSFKIMPNNISTEFLFAEEEIKAEVDGKRLYIGEEFDSRSKRHILDARLSIGGGNNSINKAGKRTIVDADVFDLGSNNVALPKERFSEAIFQDRIDISESSWMNFRHIFERILEILPAQQSPDVI